MHYIHIYNKNIYPVCYQGVLFNQALFILKYTWNRFIRKTFTHAFKMLKVLLTYFQSYLKYLLYSRLKHSLFFFIMDCCLIDEIITVMMIIITAAQWAGESTSISQRCLIWYGLLVLRLKQDFCIKYYKLFI